MKAEALTAERCPIHFKEGILWVIRNGHWGIVIQMKHNAMTRSGHKQ